jgi:hypothetical protein
MECALLQNTLQSADGTYLRPDKSRGKDRLPSKGNAENAEIVEITI